MNLVLEQARILKMYAGHFALSDWNYTRDKGTLKHIRHTTDFSGYMSQQWISRFSHNIV